jgi:RHS repeat-associated protein
MSGSVIETRYKAWGEVRYTTPDQTLPTRATYTGQYSYVNDQATDLGVNGSFGLIYFQARWVDPYITHFSSPDSIIPDQYNSLDWDRYAYSRSNPIKYTDPSGHDPVGNCYDRGYCDNDPDIVDQPTPTSTPTPSMAAIEKKISSNLMNPIGTLPTLGPRYLPVPTETPTPTPTTAPVESDTSSVVLGETLPNLGTIINFPSRVIPPGDGALLVNSFKDLEFYIRLNGGWTAGSPVIGYLYGDFYMDTLSKIGTFLSQARTPFIILPSSLIKSIIPVMD